MTPLAAAAVTTVTFLGMEFVAWFMHKYVLHGALWFLHRSHHVRHPHRFERKDFFFLFYGALSMGFIIHGSAAKRLAVLGGRGHSPCMAPFIFSCMTC